MCFAVQTAHVKACGWTKASSILATRQSVIKSVQELQEKSSRKYKNYVIPRCARDNVRITRILNPELLHFYDKYNVVRFYQLAQHSKVC